MTPTRSRYETSCKLSRQALLLIKNKTKRTAAIAQVATSDSVIYIINKLWRAVKRFIKQYATTGKLYQSTLKIDLVPILVDLLISMLNSQYDL